MTERLADPALFLNAHEKVDSLCLDFFAEATQ